MFKSIDWDSICSAYKYSGSVIWQTSLLNWSPCNAMHETSLYDMCIHDINHTAYNGWQWVPACIMKNLINYNYSCTLAIYRFCSIFNSCIMHVCCSNGHASDFAGWWLSWRYRILSFLDIIHCSITSGTYWRSSCMGSTIDGGWVMQHNFVTMGTVHDCLLL